MEAAGHKHPYKQYMEAQPCYKDSPSMQHGKHWLVVSSQTRMHLITIQFSSKKDQWPVISK